VPARIDPKQVCEPSERIVPAVFDPLKVAPHRLGAPRGVAGEIGDVVPVLVAGRDQDQRVVGRAAAERPRARIPHAILGGDEVRIAPLLRIVGIVPDEKIPAHGRVLGRERMEGGDVVVGGIGIARIPSGLEHEHRVAGFGEPGGNRATASARADDDVVGVGVGLGRGDA
jgi:hypothetical protein